MLSVQWSVLEELEDMSAKSNADNRSVACEVSAGSKGSTGQLV